MSEPASSKCLRVAVGMSGGVDSSAAAALLVEQGHEVVGLTAHLWREGSRCCSLDDVRRAIKVAEALKIPHYVVDSVEAFTGMIVHPFVSEYEHGRTPSPCVRCNQVIKFGILLREAMQLGCTHLATGHYARVEQRPDGFHLLRGTDAQKDQSYFLHRLFQDQLRHVLLPLGGRTKPEVVEYVKSKGLPVPASGESQDLCFVPQDGYAAFVEKWRPALKRPGVIVNTRGREVGRHDGFYRFTIGQREGLGVASATRLYVKEIHADTNTVVVGERDEVTCGACVVEDVHWISGKAAGEGARCSVQLRYRHRGEPSILSPLPSGGVRVTFDEPQFAVTPGQAAVFYDGDEVMGGGWIAGNLKPET